MESSSASPEDFEFNTCAAAGADVKGADDLFFKGQLLPLALPPRLQMVHNLSARKGECEEAAAAAAAPWLFYMACPPVPAAAIAGEEEAMVMSSHVQHQQRGRISTQQQHFKTSSVHDSRVGSRYFWGDSSAQPSSDSSADSSSDARDSSGSSKDSVDLSVSSENNSSNSQCGYTATAGHRARHDKFFHALSALGGKAGTRSQGELQGGHGDGSRHARVFSWLKPASSRWNGIFGGGKKKMAATEEDRRVRASSVSLATPRDSSSSDELAPAPGRLRLRHSGPLASSCEEELFLVNCRERLSGPLSFRGGSAVADIAPRSHDLAEERREWQSMHSSFRESAGWEPFMSDAISAADGGLNHSGREHWRMNPSFSYEDASNEEQQQQQLAAEQPIDATRCSVKAAKRRNWGTVAMDSSGGRNRYLDKLFRSFHVRVPLKSSDPPLTKSTKSSSRNQTSSNVPMMLNPICSTSTELHSSIQGAIAYCKRTQSSCKLRGVGGMALPSGKVL